MPAFKNHTGYWGVPNTARNPIECFAENVAYFPERNFTIAGVSKDSTGAAWGGCVCDLINTATKLVEQTVTSDASGNYAFVVDKTQRYKVDSYKAGAPDVAGCTVNTLAGI